jgi:hypothetical protein
VRQFKQLQEENARLKRLAAELSLDKPMLQDLLSKVVTPAAPPGGELPARHLTSERAACLPCGADSGLFTSPIMDLWTYHNRVRIDSRGRESQPTTRRWSRSTVRCGPSAWTCMGSQP